MSTGLEGSATAWRSLKQRLSFKNLGCCGGIWGGQKTSTMPVLDGDDIEEQPIMNLQTEQQCSTSIPSASGISLATALAAERNLPTNNGKFKTLIRLIKETEGIDLRQKKKKNKNKRKEHKDLDQSDWLCCVCMENKKGAAFIPCGHAFCRACSRDIWLNRGTCPICNCSIIDILDIF